MTAAAVPAPRHRLGGYREYDPPTALAAVAESAWVYRTPGGSTGGAIHRVLPDPAVSLAFWCRRDSDGRPVAPRLTLIGAKTRPHLVAFESGCEITALRLKLEWTRPVLGLLAADHNDGDHDLSLVLPRFGAPLLEALAETRTAEQAIRLLETAILGRLCGAEARHSKAASYALDLVRQSAGCLPIERIAGRMGLSVRHLRRTVRGSAGVSLKTYARTFRMLHAMTAADRWARPLWARLAADAGFCDQSHLVRECRALCGFTPAEVHRERQAEAEMSNPA